jgi:hypothetical protein
VLLCVTKIHKSLIMSKIIEKRRIQKDVEKVVTISKVVSNPNYSLYTAAEYQANGWYYNVPPTLRVYVPDTRRYKTTHVEYLIECELCNGTGWVRKISSKYCSSNCRKVAYRERKEAENKTPSP